MPKIICPPRLLESVKNEVSARLEQSLHNKVLVSLQNETEPRQAQRLWDIEVKLGKRSPFHLPLDVNATQVFDQAGGKLLVLGAMGSGKTTTLLELAKDLIFRAENYPQQPIPVLFNLSAWRNDNQKLVDWLVTELKSKYSIREKVGRQLINQQQLLPLLDGLNELEFKRQELCLQAINQLIAGKIPLEQIVVCARLDEYKICQTRLRLQGAIYLKPLNEIQICDYLMKSRSRELWYNIKDEPPLLELAKNPLFLNMMTLAYEEILIQAWRRLTSRQELRQYLLNAYIRRMLIQDFQSRLSRQGQEPRPEKVRHWLVFLAKRMKEENQTEFPPNPLRPSWLQTPVQQRLYLLGLVLTLGGLAGFKGWFLRFILWRNQYIPWNYPQFLGLANERCLLQRVGQRFRFIHEELREHLAQM